MTTPVDVTRWYEVNAAAAAFYAHQLVDHRPALDYLHARGIAAAADPDTPWQLGYAPPGRRTLVAHLRSRGHTDQDLHAAGLAIPDHHGGLVDRFRDRLAFPVHDPQRRTVGFTARDLSDRARAKYLNTPETPLYRKSRLLYGLGIPPTGGHGTPLVIIVEGAADAIAVRTMTDTLPAEGGIGPIWTVAPCGTALTSHHLNTLAEVTPHGARLVVAFDGDPAGRRALLRTYPLLRAWPGHTYAALLPTGVDPADLLHTHGPAEGTRHLAAALQPAARAALTLHIDSLFHHGRITNPRRYVEDQVYAYRTIAGYFIDNPHDTAALAQAAVDRLDLPDTDVLHGIIHSAIPTTATASAPPPATRPDAQPAIAPTARPAAEPATGPATGPDTAPSNTSPPDTSPPDTSAVASGIASDQGRQRWQADAAATHTSLDTRITAWALADGIGDRPEAAKAAAAAAHTAAHAATRGGAFAGVQAAREHLTDSQPGHDGDAALLVATASNGPDGTRFAIAWCGNVRAYTLRGGQPVQVSTDHTVAHQQRDTGHTVNDDSELEHLLTASVRQGHIGHVDLGTAYRSLLLATAGAYRRLDPTHLHQALGPVRDSHTTAGRLLTATGGGAAAAGSGNATVVLLHARPSTPTVGNQPAALAHHAFHSPAAVAAASPGAAAQAAVDAPAAGPVITAAVRRPRGARGR
jgi:DNA primase catalytic core